MSELVSHGML